MKATRLALSALVLVSVGMNAGWRDWMPSWRKTAEQVPVAVEETVEEAKEASTEVVEATKGIVAHIKELPGAVWQKCPSKAAVRDALRWKNIKEKASEATSTVKTQIKKHPRITVGIAAGLVASYIVVRMLKNRRAEQQRKKFHAPFN